MQTSVETLSPSLKLYISPAHRFGTDAFLLSDFAKAKKTDLACDLCSGCGIIPMLWFRQDAPKQVFALELQTEAAGLMRLSVTENGLSDRFFPLCGDLRELPNQLPRSSFSLVTCNPPYQPEGRGIISQDEAAQIARHQLTCSLPQVCEAAARLLKFSGRFCLCQRPQHLPDVMQAMRQAGLEPKRLRFVQKRADTAPWLFLLEAKKGSKPFLTVEPPLMMEEENGAFTKEVLRIYQKETAIPKKEPVSKQ